ncbi:hypothetical protein HRI_001291400 [Hibiscus trionum]|uniref:Uncharacterized protein n=1 Tax=Hibiscus trionum TaxID=183268 RepID=A0A9W7LUG5_HIBTR|nr:hypothetical protein HRI_001291400 [Hibiscus trionum]
MSTPYPDADGSDPNAWFAKNSGGGGGGTSSTTVIWIVAGILMAILVLGIAYYIMKKGKSFGLCFSCKVEFGSAHHCQSKC